jgi:hypothetical protein
MRSAGRVLAICLLASLALLSLAASPARADIQIGGDLDFALPLESRADAGGGFAVRLGPQLHIPLLVITPEVVFNYESFADTYGPVVYRGLAGVRLAVGEVFRIGPYGHIGVGRLSADVPGPDPSRTGLSYDLGLLFDFTLLPLVNLGVHGAYASTPAAADRNFHWLIFGAHAELIL